MQRIKEKTDRRIKCIAEFLITISLIVGGCEPAETPVRTVSKASQAISGRHTSAAKADIDTIEIVPGMNPRPTTRMSFSARFEAVPSENG